MITPNEVRKKAESFYWRMMSSYVAGEDVELLFPYRVPANLSPVRQDLSKTIAAVELLQRESLEKRGWGYALEWKRIKSRDFGNNLFPSGIVIATRDDLLRLLGKSGEFQACCHVVDTIGAALPQLSGWLARHLRTLADLAPYVEGLIAVTQFFLARPWPDCYARQIPVAVDTKFVERHQAILRQWLDEVLPAAAIRADETKFSFRFGLRDGQPHRAVRLLDESLAVELGWPCTELSLPMRVLASLRPRTIDVMVVENNLNLLTLPARHRTLALRGEGKAASRLAQLRWLADCPLYYWGDIDVEGFEILSLLRGLFPHVVSLMMDVTTLSDHSHALGTGSGAASRVLTNLTLGEQQAFERCAAENLRLEQEHICQTYVDSRLARLSPG